MTTDAPTALREKTIQVTIKQEDDLFIATSPNLRGLLAANTDIEYLKGVQIPRGIENLYLHHKVHVIAIPLIADPGTNDESTGLWYPAPFDYVAQKVDERRATQEA